MAEWELCGGELGAQGASWNLVIGQRSIKVQCVWSLSVAPFSRYVSLNLSLTEDSFPSYDAQAALMLCLHASLLLLSLPLSFFPSVSAVQLELLMPHLSK